uniref:Glycoprotein n=1 Tax=Syphacia muris TaxID=451379 RepID=A0A0N5AN07_9BILA
MQILLTNKIIRSSTTTTAAAAKFVQKKFSKLKTLFYYHQLYYYCLHLLLQLLPVVIGAIITGLAVAEVAVPVQATGNDDHSAAESTDMFYQHQQCSNVTVINGTAVTLQCNPAEKLIRKHMAPDFETPQLIRKLEWYMDNYLIARYYQVA